MISRCAASLVEDGDTILINGSSTALDLLDSLEDKRVTVYTNNGLVVGRSYPENIDVRIFGGMLRVDHILTGDLTLRNLMDIQADKAFVGCIGISPGGEILCGIPSELSINETMIAHADKYSQAFSKNATTGKNPKVSYEDFLAGNYPPDDAWKYSSFWYSDFDGMAEKTMLRQLIGKWGIMSTEFQMAYENDNAVIHLDEDGTYMPDGEGQYGEYDLRNVQGCVPYQIAQAVGCTAPMDMTAFTRESLSISRRAQISC